MRQEAIWARPGRPVWAEPGKNTRLGLIRGFRPTDDTNGELFFFLSRNGELLETWSGGCYEILLRHNCLRR